MFNSVEYIREICQKRNIPISLLEKECDFANGYLNPKKIKKIPYDRAQKISKYLGVSVELILTGREEPKTSDVLDQTIGYGWFPPMRFWDKINNDRARFMHYFLQTWEYPVEDIEATWQVSVEFPNDASDDMFKAFLENAVKAVCFHPEDGEWDIIRNPNAKIIHVFDLNKKTPISTEKNEHSISPKLRSISRLQDADITKEEDAQLDELIAWYIRTKGKNK